MQTFVAKICRQHRHCLYRQRDGRVRQQSAHDRQEKQAPKDWVDMISKNFMTDKPGVAAGQYLIPNIPGTQRKQKTLPSGAILVAIVTGNNILHMYYTDNAVQNVSMNIVPQLATQKLDDQSPRIYGNTNESNTKQSFYLSIRLSSNHLERRPS